MGGMVIVVGRYFEILKLKVHCLGNILILVIQKHRKKSEDVRPFLVNDYGEFVERSA